MKTNSRRALATDITYADVIAVDGVTGDTRAHVRAWGVGTRLQGAAQSTRHEALVYV